MRVVVIGANGKTGYLIVNELKRSEKHTPVAMVRSEEQIPRFDELGVETVVGDLEHPIGDCLKGADAVIFAAGSGSKTGKDKTVMIDHLGGIRSAVEAAAAGAKRFIMLSSMNANLNSESKIKHYHRAKAYADKFIEDFEEVMDLELDWTIVCPGRLIDDPPSGKVEIENGINGSAQTSRAHVAQVMTACLDHPNTIKKKFALKEGECRIEEALAAL